jgi:uncharacterized protein (DUF58 family)
MGIPVTTLQDLKRRFHPARFFRGEGPQTSPVTLDRSRVFVLPTRHGVTFAFLLCVMLIGSVNYNNSLGLGLTFLLGSMAIVSILHTYHNIARLIVRAGRADPVFAGDQARFRIEVDNASGPHRFALGLRTADPTGDAVTVDVPRGNSTLALERPAPQRGRLQLGRFVAETRFPLNLFRAWSQLDLAVECLVYPKPAPHSSSPAASLPVHAGKGDQRPGQDDFAGLRGYLRGDPPRHIHWRASARAETLLMKQFGGGAPSELWLDWEQLPGLDVETRLGVLCRWVLDAYDGDCSWGLRLPGNEIGIARGTAHLHRCLAALAVFEV